MTWRRAGGGQRGPSVQRARAVAREPGGSRDSRQWREVYASLSQAESKLEAETKHEMIKS